MTVLAIATAQQRLELGQYVELFTLDITSLGGGVLYWTPARPKDGEAIIWQGNTYTSIDVKTEGFERSSTGPISMPKITIGNTDNMIGILISDYDDLLGCTVTRTRTLYEFLDGQPAADPTAQWPLDIYKVERKASENKNEVVFELSAALDQESAMLPRHVCLRDTCMQIYRYYSGGSFDYSKATCPYVGTNYFNNEGVSVPAALDVCGLKVSDCKLRFGANAELPYLGFPGMSKVRTR